ncbi:MULTISPECIES: DUF1294 domain-containing protein [unclassified Enterococcus]|uniref:DUF1294 domain-containing protein n=1 Tax=unclassified Enterococcus TaxID=2608891 RepID=UPI002475933C|nr:MULTISPECIES: DUF1294 domain-containing protein [unclassified Enterococcus]
MINGLLFILMGVDKFKAKRQQWRIPEKTLLLLGIFGGGLAGLIAQQVFHHKSRKTLFYVVYTFGTIVAIALLSFLLYFTN